MEVKVTVKSKKKSFSFLIEVIKQAIRYKQLQ